MQKFYFTYGSDPDFPFQDGWTEVEAPDLHTAVIIFRDIHPDRPDDEDVLNCSFCYEEKVFKKTEMYRDSNFGGCCHERAVFEGRKDGQITFHRELLDAEHRCIPDPDGGRHADED